MVIGYRLLVIEKKDFVLHEILFLIFNANLQKCDLPQGTVSILKMALKINFPKYLF